MPEISREAFVPIPRPFTPRWKVEIIKDGTTYTATDYMRFLKFNKPIQTKIGKFKLILDNNSGIYTDIFTGGETVKIYIDMKDATTKQFQGFIEHPKNIFEKRGYELELTGAHESGKLLDITVTESFTDENIEDILVSLFANYASDFTYDKTTYPCEDSDGEKITATVNWSHKPFWECIVDLCIISSHDCYVDDDSELHFFAENSIDCELDAVVWKDNLIDMKGLGKDTIDVKNRVIVYGDSKGLPIIATAEDSDSQTSYNVKEKIIRDETITTMAEAQDRADAELLALKEPQLKGTVKTWGMVYLNQGERIWISIPSHKIHNKYKIIDFTQEIDRNFLFTTECEVQKSITGIPQFFRERLKTELAHEKIENPNKLKFSYNFTFDDITEGTHSNTAIKDGYLYATVGGGIWNSDTKTVTDDITAVELRYIGENLEGSTFEISVDEVNDEPITKDELISPFPHTGKKLKIKITLALTTGKIHSLGILFS